MQIYVTTCNTGMLQPPLDPHRQTPGATQQCSKDEQRWAETGTGTAGEYDHMQGIQAQNVSGPQHFSVIMTLKFT